ncbi:MAG TPA: UDP-N-acetylmuramoyl-L-alanine--D-glutamate ligase [Candidatus Binatia bacterium]|nr:UDP-N-acetylmuramoyl-L-alanine--D-glutamate ligase [Candidatus Binatia bacterium]
MSMAGKSMLVLGLARSGVAAANLADRLGCRVYLTDDKDVAVQGAPAAAERVAPSAAPGLVSSIDFVVPSPGVPSTHPVLEEARTRGVVIVPEIELAADHLGDTRLLAVTGTNGKSTTVTLLGAILTAAGYKTFTGGNLGSPLSNAALGDYDIAVAEVSSFQLEWATTFHPHVASLLNVTADHLDRHGDMAGYLAAKIRLFANMTGDDFAVFARGADWLDAAALSTHAHVSTFGWEGSGGTTIDRGARTLRGEDDFLVRLPERWPRLPHDLENAAAAAEMVRVLGIDADAVERALASFQPLRHRLALVAEIGGVSWWNDSKATNVGATLSSLRAFDGNVVLLAGGVSKGCDFAPLAAEASRIKLAIAYGACAAEVESALAAQVRVVVEPGLQQAVTRAAREAAAGDTVLLAPACASFDEFRDYVDRGDKFEGWVRGLQEVVR